MKGGKRTAKCRCKTCGGDGSRAALYMMKKTSGSLRYIVMEQMRVVSL